MKNIAIAVLTSAAIWSATAARAAEPQAASDPRFEARVTISYRDTPAHEVLVALAKARDNGLHVVVAPELTAPVTITLTNVKLRTALDAVCQSAHCNWELESNQVMRFTVAQEPAPSIPRTVSLHLTQVSPQVALQAIAAALNVTLIVETEIPSVRVGSGRRYNGALSNWNIENADTKGTLRLLGDITGCVVELNEQTRTLRVSACK